MSFRLLCGYVLLLPFRRLDVLPGFRWLGTTLDLTEILFLGIAPLALYEARTAIWPRRQPLVYLLVGFLAVLTVSTLAAATPSGYFELLGRYYLLAVFLIFLWAVRSAGPSFLATVFRCWTYGVVGLVTTAYLGYPLGWLGISEALVWVYEDYPYFGTIYRATGLAGGSTPLILLLLPPLFHRYWTWRDDGRVPWLLVYFAPILVLTLSKEVLLVPIALLLAVRGSRRTLRYVCAGIVILAYNFSTHFLVQPVRSIAGTVYERAEYSPGRVAYRGDSFQLLETTYVSLKRTACYLTNRHPIAGVGADQFQQILKDDRPTEVYPAHLPPYNPHSAWFGVAAEVGYLGLLALVGMVAIVGRKLWENTRQAEREGAPYNRALLATCVAFLVVSVNYDMVHFNFVWVAFALVLGQTGEKWSESGA